MCPGPSPSLLLSLGLCDAGPDAAQVTCPGLTPWGCALGVLGQPDPKLRFNPNPALASNPEFVLWMIWALRPELKLPKPVSGLK